MRGREFHIAVLIPCDSGQEVGRKLFGTQFSNVFYLAGHLMPYRDFRFKNDVHWNEIGSIKAAEATLSYPGLGQYFTYSEKRAMKVPTDARDQLALAD